jgi:plastocyanin
MFRIIVFLTLAVSGAACSSGKSPAAPTTIPVAGTPSVPSGPATISITANGMSPLELTIAVGQRVTFINDDTRTHDVVGGKDPATPDCPEITRAGFLAPGQRAETGVFSQAKTCEYHDHTMLGVPAFQGRIIIR